MYEFFSNIIDFFKGDSKEFWIVWCGGWALASLIYHGIKEHRKSAEQKRQEREYNRYVKQLSRDVYDEIMKDAWWI